MSMSDKENFEAMGRGYQERVVQAILTNHMFADQMIDVLEPSYFTSVELEGIVKTFFGYRRKYREFPSIDAIPVLMKNDEQLGADPLVQNLASGFLRKMVDNPLNGDRPWIEESSLEFCRKQALSEALVKMVDDIDNSDFTGMSKRLRDALEKGAPRDLGHDYHEGLESRAKKAARESISTGWPALDKILNGGWERGTLCTFIGATGSGKSMFLVNSAGGLLEQGFNVLYVTLEMADWKIGLRTDSWFGECPIDAVPDNVEHIKKQLSTRCRGKLKIKEWPTKRATVDTIRNHVHRLRQVEGFVPDAVIVDYADLLRSSSKYGEKRHELEAVYEELRALAQELKVVLLTVDQTNRAGLDQELVTLSSISEAYAKATVCDLIMTITRTFEDKMVGVGKLYNAKSRLGTDGQVLEFIMDTNKTVKVTLCDQGQSAVEHVYSNGGGGELAKERLRELQKKMKREEGN
jgi:archaellum biogenesis ATPase FlaH